MLTTTVYGIESYEKSDFPKLVSLYDEDEQLHVECVAYGKPERCDYGVPGSPEWVEIEDITVNDFEINGVAYTWSELVAKFGDEIADELHVICADRAAEKEDWS